MKTYTKTLAILLATTCLNAVYAMDFSDSVPLNAAVSGGGSGGSGSTLASPTILVSLVRIDPSELELIERIRSASNNYSVLNPISTAIKAIPDAPTRNLVLGYHIAKANLGDKIEDAREKKGTPQESAANSQVEDAQRYLESLDRWLTFLDQNGGGLEVAASAVSVEQDEAGRGWLATAFNSDGFDVKVATRQSTFDSLAFNKAKVCQFHVSNAEAEEAYSLRSLMPIPNIQLKREYAFLDFFNPGENFFSGLVTKSEGGFLETMKALRRFHDGSLVAELQVLFTRIHEKAETVRTPAEGITLFEGIDTIAMVIDKILVLLGDGSPFGKAFKQDIAKAMSSFAPLHDLCFNYVKTLGIQEKAFSVTDSDDESKFALETVLVSDIYEVMRHLEKILSILQEKGANSNPFQKQIDKLSQFLKDDQEFLGLLETHDLSATIAAIDAENQRLSDQLRVAEALVEANRLQVEERRDELRASGALEGAFDATLEGLEFKLRTAEGKVADLQRHIESNTKKWIPALSSTFSARESLRGFHEDFVRQYHVLQAPKVWESAKLEELGTLRQCLTNLNMLMDELKGFYNEAHHEVVKVAARAGKVFDMRHTPSLIANGMTEFKEVLLPLAPSLAPTDGGSAHTGPASGDGSMDGAPLVKVPQAGFLAAVGLKTLEDGRDMTNPLKHLADIENMINKTRSVISKK